MGALVLVVQGNRLSPFFDHATKACTAPVWHPRLGGHKQTVLVTGAGGFIASHVAKHCKNYGMNVIAVDDLSGGFTTNIPGGVTFVQGDLKDPEFVANLFAKYEFDFVYHLAVSPKATPAFHERSISYCQRPS
jgi:D-arabinose 1-dehydrogenase-like Zn-dependent alcohol dehydrogenase